MRKYSLKLANIKKHLPNSADLINEHVVLVFADRGIGMAQILNDLDTQYCGTAHPSKEDLWWPTPDTNAY